MEQVKEKDSEHAAIIAAQLEEMQEASSEALEQYAAKTSGPVSEAQKQFADRSQAMMAQLARTAELLDDTRLDKPLVTIKEPGEVASNVRVVTDKTTGKQTKVEFDLLETGKVDSTSGRELVTVHLRELTNFVPEANATEEQQYEQQVMTAKDLVQGLQAGFAEQEAAPEIAAVTVSDTVIASPDLREAFRQEMDVFVQTLKDSLKTQSYMGNGELAVLRAKTAVFAEKLASSPLLASQPPAPGVVGKGFPIDLGNQEPAIEVSSGG